MSAKHDLLALLCAELYEVASCEQRRNCCPMVSTRNNVRSDICREMSVLDLHTDAIGPGSPGQVRNPKAASGPVLVQCMVLAAAASTLQHLVDSVMKVD